MNENFKQIDDQSRVYGIAAIITLIFNSALAIAKFLSNNKFYYLIILVNIIYLKYSIVCYINFIF